jgi:hypothetical protein
MTRLDRVIKCFNDYDKLVKDLQLKEVDSVIAEYLLNEIRAEVSQLIGELKRYDCRRED